MNIVTKVRPHLILHRLKQERGQATVELAVVMPVVLAVALIVVNVLGYLGTCASFDRIARHVVCALAAAPASHESTQDTVLKIEEAIESGIADSNATVKVTASGKSSGLITYCATLNYVPTLFGRAFRGEVFGVSFPSLTHAITMTVDPYRAGAQL